jgi:hypothetical protein
VFKDWRHELEELEELELGSRRRLQKAGTCWFEPGVAEMIDGESGPDLKMALRRDGTR